MDFFKIQTKNTRQGVELYPDFTVNNRMKDFMVRGKSFYAIWDEENNIWSTDEYDVARLVDEELRKAANDYPGPVTVKWMESTSNGSWYAYKKFIKELPDNARQLDQKIVFKDQETTKKDYVSKTLPYSLDEGGDISAYDELVSTLYNEEERRKIEWAIGSIFAGDSVRIQKFVVLYGEPGTGKGTIINIILKLFQGYTTVFEAKSLVGNNNQFATSDFRNNPLVAIQHDGDLSRIEDNSKLNSIISHEDIVINEKFKSSYSSRINSFLFMGSNKPVQITDAKSGVLRRLIDVTPTGQIVSPKRYDILMSQLEFELGAIAAHCLKVYRSLGKNYYNSYRPFKMIEETDFFYNFLEDDDQFFKYKSAPFVTLKEAYNDYKQYCVENGREKYMPITRFRSEIKTYFRRFEERYYYEGKYYRSVFVGFKSKMFEKQEEEKEEQTSWLVLDQTESIFDKEFWNCPAQYSTSSGTPTKAWSKVTTLLKDIDTTKEHYVKIPESIISIDFDLRDENGNKSYERNLEAASKWPPTYAELSKSGCGIHLEYRYVGDDLDSVSNLYSDGIEIKKQSGNASLRRRLTKCNNLPIAEIRAGLPLKEKKKMVSDKVILNEAIIRKQIVRNLHKEIHGATTPSVDMIKKILDDAYNSGTHYDVSDMYPAILSFAAQSSNQSERCVKTVTRMKFKSDDISLSDENYSSDELTYFDIESFPNLFIICYAIGDRNPVKMINPTREEVKAFLDLKLKLVGYNCRRYDNHMVYAARMGYSIEQLYNLSQRIISGSKNAMIGEAYNLSYTDVYDYASNANKMSLKKWEIKLGLTHVENSYDWNKPVPEDKWDEVADYCCNDVIATRATHKHLAGDFAARLILADLSGLTPNDTTNAHTTKIIFGNDPNPQSQFVYTDLSTIFPGYKYENGKSTYKGYEVGEGGFVYAEPGIYGNVPVDDVESMHPHSIYNLGLFGPKYTERFYDLVRARLYIKHKDFEKLKGLFEGKLVKYIDNAQFSLKDLSTALKTAINSVYGLTAAHFDNKFKDPRNKDNIVAKRGALFMIDLMEKVKEKGFKVAHIKTDSIKIPDATSEILDFVSEFGKKYGYKFACEEVYDKMCLVNDAVYIARYSDAEVNEHPGQWTATGAEFAHPVIFKTLFSKEEVTFEDLKEVKSVTTSMYLDMDEGLPEGEHNYVFVGKVGSFVPIKPGKGGGRLYSKREDRYCSVTGTKDFRWLESDVVKTLKKEDDIDETYYAKLINDAVAHIDEVSNNNFDWLVSDDKYIGYIPRVKEDCLPFV